MIRFLVGACLVAALLWGVLGQVRAGRALARADMTRDSLTLVRTALDADHARRVVHDREDAERGRAYRDTVVSVRARLDALDREVAQRVAHLDTVLAEDTTITPGVRDAALAAVSVLTAAGEACRVGWMACDSVSALAARRLTRADSTVAEQAAVIHALDVLVSDYRRLASPPWYEQVRRALPWVALSATLGLAIGLSL